MRAQRVFVVADDLRVLPELPEGDGVDGRDRGQLAELARWDKPRDLRVLGQQHLHRGDLAGPDRGHSNEGVEDGSGADHAEQDGIDDDKRESAVGRRAEQLVDGSGERQPEERHEDDAADKSDEKAENDGENKRGQRPRNAARNDAHQAGMGRDDPVGEQEGSLGQKGADQAFFPANQDAEPDHDDDRQINQVHSATPLSPMAPRNSTPGVSSNPTCCRHARSFAGHARAIVKADELEKSLESPAVPLDIDAALHEGRRRRYQLKHEVVERLDAHRHGDIRIRCPALAGGEASIGDTDFEDEIGNAHFVGLGHPDSNVWIKDSAHRHEVGSRNHRVGLFRCPEKAGTPSPERDYRGFERLACFGQLIDG